MMTISADQVIKSSDNVTKYQYSALTRPHHLARPSSSSQPSTDQSVNLPILV